MKSSYKFILLLLLLISCSENSVVPNSYYYNFSSTNSICSKINDSQYVVKIDTSKFQTFLQLDVNTNNDKAHYVDWRWQSRDTFFVYVNGINAGPLPPTNLSSVLVNGQTSTIFGFHKSTVGDTINVLATFIDSKSLTHKISEKYLFFIVE